MSFAVGSLVKARGREWVVLPESAEDLLVLRPLGGTEDEVTGIYLPLEPVEPATFALPEPSQAGDYRSCRLLRDAVRLGFRSSAGPFRAFARIAVEPRPYQLVPLLLALRLDPVRLLIADDVGIGKTIEACLIARELLDRGEIERLAVLCSPQLAPQWQNELRDKFHIEAEIVLPGTVTRLERNCRLNQSIFDLYPHVIVSTDFIKADRRRDEFLRACPEMVIVDEAHTCAYGYDNRGGRHQRYQLVSQLATHPQRHVILVTATPHSGNEAAFRSLLGMLHADFASLPEDLSGRENEPHRRRLAAHFVQRRRADIRRYLDVDTVFPERQEAEDTYRLASDYKRLFERVLNYARETVSDTGGTLHRQRVRWWSALALLRSLASSPAAAVATLRTRAASADTETAEEADAIGRQTVLDLQADEMVESLDLTPGSDLGDAGDAEMRARRRLLDMAREAEKLLGTRDEKLKKAISLIDAFSRDGFNPIVFCRFIPTAEYVAEELRKKLRDVEVAAVTGTLPPDERGARVAQLAQAKKRVLVCTDCLSEGINLQEHFDAVLHYDLSWNPTRHEQREGRVDRYGQPSRTVRVLTFYGIDNQIDGIVLDVLIRKHKTIRSSLGISVPVPVDTNQVVEAIFEGLLLRGPSGTSAEQMLLFEDFFTPHREDLYGKWDAATEREKRSRTMFAQETIKVDDVARELQAVRAAIGSSLNVAAFTQDALRAHGAVIAEWGSREWGVESREQNTERRIEIQRNDDRIVSRSPNLEAGDGNSSGMLPGDAQLSERRTLRSDLTNPSSRLFDPEQHRGRLREGKHEGLHSVPPNRSGQSERNRDASNPVNKSQSRHQSPHRPDTEQVHATGENAAHADSSTPEKTTGPSLEHGQGLGEVPPYSPLPIPRSLHFDLSEVPRALREAMRADAHTFTARFDLPVKDSEVYLSRTHPLVEGLATYVMDTALDPLGQGLARRCGVMRTSRVARRTTLLLVRLRYHIVTRHGEQEKPLLAEDCQVLAFAGAPQNAEWLDSDTAEALLDATPDANITPEQAADFVHRVIEDFAALQPYLDQAALRRGEALLEAHRRVRTASQVKGISYRVEAQLPPDVLGIYVYLPKI